MSMSTSSVPGLIDAAGGQSSGTKTAKKTKKSGGGGVSSTTGVGSLIGSPDKGKSNLVILSTSSKTVNHQNSGSPMDLAPRGPSVVQLRPVRPVFGTLTSSPNPGKQVGPGSGSGMNVNNNGGSGSTPSTPGVTPIISVNRSAPTNLTVLPNRATGPVGLMQGNTQGIPTYQITRVGNVRPVLGPGGGQQQPASITVTPLSNPK